MKHLFLINPVAGKKGSTQRLISHIVAKFSALGLEHEIHLTQEAKEAETYSRNVALQGDPLRIYVCGGDGTLNEVVNGVAGFDHVAITNVPKGTGNDFIRIFGEDSRRGFCDLAALAKGPQTAFDLIDCNGRLGLDVVCAGIDARVGNDVHKFKSFPMVKGPGAYILSLADNVLFKGVSRHARVTMGDRHWDEEITIICICNGRHYGGGFMPMPNAMPDDGILDMLVIPKISKAKLAMIVGDYAKGRYEKYPDLMVPYHGTEMSFSADEEMVVVVDGELVRGNDFHVKLSEHKVNFFYPDYLDYKIDKSKEEPLQEAEEKQLQEIT